MPNLEKDLWHWYHNVSECFYHVQITVKYRKSVLDEGVQKIMRATVAGLKERYAIDVSEIGFDQNHVHLLCQFLPKYSGGDVVRLLKSLSAKEVFRLMPSIKKELWGGEFWTDGYYIGTISNKGNKAVIERYIRNQGREKEIPQLTLFDV